MDVVGWDGAPLLALLSVIAGHARGQSIALSRGQVMIGRDASCALPIPDERISRRHLQVTYDPSLDRHMAIDVGSSNGVTINGQRLVRGVARVLADRDEIEIGSTKLCYSANSELPGRV